MTSINSKMGFKPAGRRRMMNLPGNRTAAAALTRLQCPRCGERWILENAIHGIVKRMCSRCAFTCAAADWPEVTT